MRLFPTRVLSTGTIVAFDTIAMAPRVCFVADIHGNMSHLRRVVQYLLSSAPSTIASVVVGGDVSPRSASHARRKVEIDPENESWRGVLDQSAWFEHLHFIQQSLIPELERLFLPVIVMPGNTDFAAPFAKAMEEHKRLKRNSNVALYLGLGDVLAPGMLAPASPPAVLLSPVPMCHHAKKDYERFDCYDVQVTLDRAPDISLHGVVSCTDGSVEQFSFDASSRRFVNSDECLEGLLEDAIARSKAEYDGASPDLWFTHSPPQYCLDSTERGTRAGSLAVRRLMERERPLATISGHIHEAVRRANGVFCQEVAPASGQASVASTQRTFALSVGQDFKEADCHVLLLDLDDISSSSRIRLPPGEL